MTRLNDGFRVITQEETPLFRAHVVLFDLKARNVPVSDYIQFERSTCPVKLENGTVIGSAHLFGLSSTVQANVVIDYHSPERLDLDLDAPVYATPEGTCFLNGSLTVDYVDVVNLVLTSRPLADTSVLVHRA